MIAYVIPLAKTAEEVVEVVKVTEVDRVIFLRNKGAVVEEIPQTHVFIQEVMTTIVTSFFLAQMGPPLEIGNKLGYSTLASWVCDYDWEILRSKKGLFGNYLDRKSA